MIPVRVIPVQEIDKTIAKFNQDQIDYTMQKVYDLSDALEDWNDTQDKRARTKAAVALGQIQLMIEFQPEMRHERPVITQEMAKRIPCPFTESEPDL